ncbi:hypothetical protein EIP86_007355 [Pleurotus ostreatoroseus]|nr:hypothetical protein EIP86_007355 [Pleurotus ostreatoroseus]
MGKGKRKAPVSFYVHNSVTTNNAVLNVSSDNRRVRMRQTQAADVSLPEPPASNAPFDSSSLDTGDDLSFNDPPGDFEGVVHQLEFSDQVRSVRVVTKQKAKRYENSDAPLKTFLAYREQYIDENLRSEGRGDYQHVELCPDCGASPPRVRCKECHGQELVCEKCIVSRHSRLPLHTIEVRKRGSILLLILTAALQKWEDGYFIASSLFALGLRISFGHIDNTACPLGQERELVVIHTNGIHRVKVSFCRCNFGVKPWQQLMRASWWPATPLDPHTAATFQVLRQFHYQNLQGHITTYDFYRSLEILTDGRLETQIPDANFRLKSRFRQTNVEDVSLSPGWGCFVEHREYLAHVRKFANQEEISTCAGFQALHLANLKKMRGLSATGVAGCICSRHEMWRTLGDLQKGERYCNMDYILATSLLAVAVLCILATYDIACQYFANLWARREDLPLRLQPAIEQFQDKIKAKVPKAHILGHGKACHGIYALNYTDGAGRLDGEGIERCWASLNKAAPSTKEMTPSGRKEALDDFCNFSNYRKTLALGDTLLRRMLEGLKEAAGHKEEFTAFDAALRKEHAESVVQWEKEVQAFAKDPSKPCPYIVDSDTITVQEAKLKLMVEEETLMREGKAMFSSQEGSPTAFILLGLEIEDLQENIKRDVVGTNNTLQQTTRMERRISLWKKILQFRKSQAVYMPGLSRAIRTIENQYGSPGWQQAENVSLYLPSSLDTPTRGSACDSRTSAIEETLREAQAYEALDGLRRELRARVFANRFKIKNVTGQRANTKARDWQKTIDQKAITYKHRYRRARAALLALRGPGEWSEKALRELTDADVRAFNERAMTDEEARERQEARRLAGLVGEEVLAIPIDGTIELGEGRRRVSWIWYSMGTIGLRTSDEDLNEALKVEWARSHARSRSWIEEVALIWEEMRRSVHYCRWLAEWWEEQASRRTGVSGVLAEGLTAFARKQAAAERALAQRWETKFMPVRQRAEEFLKTTHLAGALALKELSCNTSAPIEPIDVEMNSQAGPEGITSLPLEELVQLALEDPTDDLDYDEFD